MSLEKVKIKDKKGNEVERTVLGTLPPDGAKFIRDNKTMMAYVERDTGRVLAGPFNTKKLSPEEKAKREKVAAARSKAFADKRKASAMKKLAEAQKNAAKYGIDG